MPPYDQQLTRNELRQALRDLREDLKNDFRDSWKLVTDRIEGHDDRIRKAEQDIARLEERSKEAGRHAGRASGAKYGGLIAGALYALLELARLIFTGATGHK